MSTEIEQDVREYALLQQRIKALQTLQEPIKERLVSVLDSEGLEDDKHHRWISFETPVSGVMSIQRQRKVSIGLDLEESLRILEQKNLTETCVKMVPSLVDDGIAAARFKNLLSDEDLDKMFPKKITWALVLQRK